MISDADYIEFNTATKKWIAVMLDGTEVVLTSTSYDDAKKEYNNLLNQLEDDVVWDEI